MKRTIIFVIILICLSIALFFTLYGFVKIEIFPNGKKTKIIRKLDNPNASINFLKPSVNTFVEIQDLIFIKKPADFDLGFAKKENLCSRVIGKPGDIVQIKNSNVYVNDKELIEDYELYYLYRVSTENIIDDFESFLGNNYVEIREVFSTGNSCDIIANQYQAEKISKLDGVLNIRKIIKAFGVGDYGLFPKSNRIIWNHDNYGPIKIPQKGETVSLDLVNIAIYRDIIDIHEENDLFFNPLGIEINGRKTDVYTFRNNYYFVLSNYRENYNDSRKWGFVPEDLIIGKVLN